MGIEKFMGLELDPSRDSILGDPKVIASDAEIKEILRQLSDSEINIEVHESYGMYESRLFDKVYYVDGLEIMVLARLVKPLEDYKSRLTSREFYRIETEKLRKKHEKERRRMKREEKKKGYATLPADVFRFETPTARLVNTLEDTKLDTIDITYIFVQYKDLNLRSFLNDPVWKALIDEIKQRYGVETDELRSHVCYTDDLPRGGLIPPFGHHPEPEPIVFQLDIGKEEFERGIETKKDIIKKRIENVYRTGKALEKALEKAKRDHIERYL